MKEEIITKEKENNELELVFDMNGEFVTTSKIVAETFEKDHFHVLRDIEKIIFNDTNFGLVEKMFSKSAYKDLKGELRPMYYMNRDGFSLLAMGFTTKKALQWKIKYIEAFNKMESTIKNQLLELKENKQQLLNMQNELSFLKEQMTIMIQGQEKMIDVLSSALPRDFVELFLEDKNQTSEIDEFLNTATHKQKKERFNNTVRNAEKSLWQRRYTDVYLEFNRRKNINVWHEAKDCFVKTGEEYSPLRYIEEMMTEEDFNDLVRITYYLYEKTERK